MTIAQFTSDTRPLPKPAPPPPAYAELMVTSNFSFLRSGSHPEELVSVEPLDAEMVRSIRDRTGEEDE